MKSLVRSALAGVLALGTAAGVLTGLAPVALADANSRSGVVAERPRDAGVHAIDGEVRTVAQVGGSVVLGGNFTAVGPVTRGAGGVVDIAGTSFGASFPDVNGTVQAAVPDGSGGWYVGGTFGTVAGQLRTNVAHVDASGGLTTFAPSLDGSVYDLTLTGADLVIGGDFTTVNGQSAAGVARIDTAGQLVWGADVAGGPVRAVAVSNDGALVYAGGEFSKVHGATVRRLVAVDAGTGQQATGWAAGSPNLGVYDIVVRPSGEVLVAGQFTKVGGVPRTRLASLDGSTGALGSLDVSINNLVSDLELDDSSQVLYIAGSFGSVAGAARSRLAGIDLTSGAVTSLSVSAITGTIQSLAADGAGGLFLGGDFQITPEKANPAILARVDVSTNAVTSVVPYAQTPRSLARQPQTGTSAALTLERSGGSLFVGGDFSDYGSVARSGLAAYDLATGALRSDFDPAPNGQVMTVKSSADGNSAFVGGEFDTIGGQSHSRIAKLSIADGSNVPGFTASADSYVKDLAVRSDGTAVYVGGNFAVFNDAPASRLTAISPTSGATLSTFSMPLTEPTNDTSEGGLRAMALSADETRLMVIGNFRKINGLERPLMAQIDVSGSVATVTPWQTDVYDQPCAHAGKIGYMRDIDISPDGSTAYVVSSGHFYYPACDTLNAFPTASTGGNVQPTWSTKIGDTLEAVAADRDAVYISGHFRYLDTETHSDPRFQIAAVEPATGKGINWVPNAGGYRGVLALELEPAGLFAGSDGDAFGGVNHGRNAFWPNPNPGIEVRKAPNRSFVEAPDGDSVHYQVRVQNTFSDRSVTLTGLADDRLGDLASSGTCTVPQTLAPGAQYNCTTAAELVNGPLSSLVEGTVTATGLADTQAVSDTDTSHVIVQAATPTFRLRAVAGPAVIAYPGGTVRFSLTMMNLDPLNATTVTSLSNPDFGDLSSECGLPKQVGPSELIYCRIDREVTGSVGSRPAFPFTSTATFTTGDSPGQVSATSSQTLTIDPPVGGTKVLAVVSDPAALGSADLKVTSQLDDAYAVTYVDDDLVDPATISPEYSLVVLYPSVREAKIGTRLRSLDLPMLVLHSRVLDEMGMAQTGGQTITANQVEMVTGRHPLAAALAGTQTISSKPKTVGYATPEPGASVISTVAGGGATEFAYTKGTAMAGGTTAAACRVYINAVVPGALNNTGWNLVNRAAAYASMNCGKNMLWTAGGNGSTANTPEGAQAVATGMPGLYGVAVDSQDRVYYADASQHRVRRIEADGTVTDIAGTGTAGFSGDGGQATQAMLRAPSRLAFDAAGNLYIADTSNNRIRKVDVATGVISTVVGTGSAGNTGDGGQATAARLRTPYDVTFAPDGTMYIADRGNQKVRKVDTSGVITTFAGNGTAGYNGDDIPATSARLYNPYSVDVAADGSVLIADYDNERIRSVDAGGTITTFAGTGIASVGGDGGPAAEAGLHKPIYVYAAPNGDVYIGESNNNRIRLVHDGLIDTFAGSGEFGYVGDGGLPLFSTWRRPSSIAADSQGNLWVIDRSNRRIRVINAS
ncbi:MAG: hypothetical protein ACK5MT_19525 [Actinomycetales bacterium]